MKRCAALPWSAMRGFRILVAVLLAAAVGLLAWNARGSRQPAVERASVRAEVPFARDEPARLDKQTPVASPASLVSNDAEVESARSAVLSGLVLMGTCTAADGSQLPDKTSYVWFLDEAGHGRQSSLHSGGWSVDGLKPGRGSLEGCAVGYMSQRIAVVLRADVPVQHFDLKLEHTGVIQVRFETSEGVLLRDVDWKEGHPRLIALATREDPGGRRSDSIWADETLSPLARWEDWYSSRSPVQSGQPPNYDGVLVFEQPLPAYVSAVMRSVVLETKRVLPGTHELVFQISIERLRSTFGSVRGRIVDGETGNALADAALGFWDMNRTAVGKTNEHDGTFLWENVEPGLHRFSVQSNGHEWLLREIVVESGRVLELGDVRLDAALVLNGRVVDSDGNGVEAKVNVMDLARFEHTKSSEEYVYVQCDATGKFSRGALGRRRYLVRIDSEDWRARPVRVDLSKGPIDDVVIHATHPTRILIRPIVALEWDEWVAIDDEEGLRVLDRRLYDTMPFGVRLAPGNYTLRHLRGEKLLGERAIEVGSESFELDLP
jgi:hypothetical protein